MKPFNQLTPSERIAAARAWFTDERLERAMLSPAIADKVSVDMIRVLLAATVSDPGPPRPDDRVELARLVAKELRSRGVWARMATLPWNVEGVAVLTWDNGYGASWKSISLDNYPKTFTPRNIADVIQAEEAAKAKAWAGDTPLTHNNMDTQET